MDCQYKETTEANENPAISVDLRILDNVLPLVDSGEPIDIQVSSSHLTIEYDNAETSCHHVMKLKGEPVKVAYYDVSENYPAQIRID